MSADRWGDLSRSIVACVLEQPGRLSEVPRDFVAPGPSRLLYDLLTLRAREGLAYGWAAVRGLADAREVAGADYLATLMDEPIAQSTSCMPT